MDYVVGSVAALITGNVTPNGPRIVKRALTPTKHQPSPNVTPKSGLVDDRSIFLSPSVQKKKAIVKKSPKRIFQGVDCDTTNEGDGIAALSPNTDKVKKHLKNELDGNPTDTKQSKSPKSPSKKRDKSADSQSPNKKIKDDNAEIENLQETNETTPKKKKKDRKPFTESPGTVTEDSVTSEETGKSPKKNKGKKISISELMEVEPVIQDMVVSEDKVTAERDNNDVDTTKIPKKKKGKKRSLSESMEVESEPQDSVINEETIKKNKKKSKKKQSDNIESKNKEETNEINTSESLKETLNEGKAKKKKNRRKKKKSKALTEEPSDKENFNEKSSQTKSNKSSKPKNKKVEINQNAITNEDTDSEHDSDDDIQSETEKANKELLEHKAESSDEEEEEENKKTQAKQKKQKPEKVRQKDESPEDEVKRTLFVGNVPLTPKCKKEIKKLFSKYGAIETVRIRTVPVKDARVTPKMAIIKNELHPERSTVNVYVKFVDPSCVDQALVENNTVFMDHHLRVSRSDTTGVVHDPKCSVFVGNLPFALEDEALRGKFEKCGEIESVRIIRDKKTNAGKGFGYVNFASKDGVELALAMSEEDLTIKNRIIRVKRITHNERKTNQRGGFHGSNSQGGKFQGGNSRGDSVQGSNSQRGKFQGSNRGGRFQGGSFRGGMNQGRNGRGGNFQGGRSEESGAFRRVMNKRQNQENVDGPPNKISKNIDQPSKEKKTRKEFVGMTAEKKKKRKFDKGQKKKKAISEILTK